MTEMDRLTARARSLMDELDGTKASEIEARVAQAIAALRAKGRRKLKTS